MFKSYAALSNTPPALVLSISSAMTQCDYFNWRVEMRCVSQSCFQMAAISKLYIWIPQAKKWLEITEETKNMMEACTIFESQGLLLLCSIGK